MNHTLLLNCRRLFLTGLTVQASIGVHDFEQQASQRLIIDVDLYVSFEGTRPKDDRIDEVVDYDFVRAVVHERIARGHIGLQETLCDDILTRLLDHTGVMAARVSTRKPDVYPDCEAVGVEAFRAKPGVL
nr:dihydroneopterin aldolase [uncultured Limnohabitans sp.]